MNKYFFEYKNNVAKVYLSSEKWGKGLVATFQLGKDAKEYVDFLNNQLNNGRGD